MVPVKGSTPGVRTSFSPSTVVVLGTVVVGGVLTFSPNTVEQKLLAVVGTQFGGGLPHWLLAVVGTQFGGGLPHWLLAVVGTQSGGGLPHWLLAVVGTQSGGGLPHWLFAVVGTHVGGGVVLHPVCAGFVLPMPWLRSHSYPALWSVPFGF
jgi:hypothetical protein